MDATDRSSLKKADLASGIGAFMIGTGGGLLLPRQPFALGIWLLAAGIVAHAGGMFAKHRIEQNHGPGPKWAEALYWACWLLLATLAVVLLRYEAS